MNIEITQLITKVKEIANKYHQDMVSTALDKMERKKEQKEVTILIVGEFNSGKSSLVNALVGKNILETGPTPTTDKITQIVKIGGHPGNTSVHPSPDTTDTQTHFVDCDYLYQGLVLIDTPGLSSPNPQHMERLYRFLSSEHVDVILATVDSGSTISKSLLDFLKNAALLDRTITLVYTKSDQRSPSELEKLREYAKTLPGVSFDRVLACSALEKSMQEIIEYLQHTAHQKEAILARSLPQLLQKMCNLLRSQLQERLDMSRLDIRPFEERLQKKTETLNKATESIRATLGDGKNRMEKIIRRSQERLRRALMRERHYNLLSNKQGEELEDAFDRIVSEAVQIELNQVLPELKAESIDLNKEIADHIQKDLEAVDVGDTIKINVLRSETLNTAETVVMVTALFDDVLAALTPIKAQPVVAAVLLVVTVIWKTIKPSVTKYLATKKVKEALEKACEQYGEKLTQVVSDALEKLESVWIQERVKPLYQEIEEIKRERKENIENYEKYQADLKRDLSEVVRLKEDLEIPALS